MHYAEEDETRLSISKKFQSLLSYRVQGFFRSESFKYLIGRAHGLDGSDRNKNKIVSTVSLSRPIDVVTHLVYLYVGALGPLAAPPVYYLTRYRLSDELQFCAGT